MNIISDENVQMIKDTFIVESKNALDEPWTELLTFMETYHQELSSRSHQAIDSLPQVYVPELTMEKYDFEMPNVGTALVGQDRDFGIFAVGENFFDYEQVIWDTLITRVVTYPFLFVAFGFFMVVYPIIDLFYILSFNWSELSIKLSSQFDTFSSLLVDIVTGPI